MPGGLGSAFRGGTPTGPPKNGPGGLGSAFRVPVEQQQPASGGRHGVLGFVENVGSDLYHAAVNTPAGVYYLGKGLATHPIGTLEAVGKSTIEDFRHPLRHPGYTLLDLLGVASASAGTLGRVGAAAHALEEGGTAGSALKAVLAKPNPGPRVFKVGGSEVKGDYSRAPITRAVQKGSDTLLKRKHEQNPTGKLGKRYEKRVNKALQLNTRHEAAISQGPAAALQVMGRRLKPEEQTALRVVANEAPLADRIKTVQQRIANASSAAERARHEERLTNLERAGKLLTEDQGLPKIRPGLKKLQSVYDQMAAVAKSREELLQRIDALTPEGSAQHKTDVGRVALGQPRDDNALRFDAAAAGIEHQPENALAARLTAIEGEYGKLVESAMSGKPGDYKSVTALQNGRLRKAGHAPVRDQLIANAEQSILDTMRRNPEHPVVKAWQTKLAEADAIRAELARRSDVKIGLEKGRTLPEPTPLFRASERAVYVPEKVTRRGAKTLGRTPGLGQQGTIGHTRAPTSLTAGYTGKAAEHALERQDTTSLVAEAGLEAAKYDAVLHLKDLVKGMGHKAPQSHDDVFVRLGNLKPHEATPLQVRRFLDNPGEHFVDEHDRQQHFADFLAHHFVSRKTMTPGDVAEFEKLASQGKGVWVSKTLLGDFAKPQAPLRATAGKAVDVIDAVNNASRFAILYLKPAYAAPNLLGNVALNLIQQGPLGLVRTLHDSSKLSFQHPELTARIDTLVGEGVARSAAGETGIGSRAVQGAANIWSKAVDTPFRRSAFIYEARKAGYKTPGDLERLLTSPEHHDDLLAVTRRANREIIDYGRLGHREKEIVRRAVFFYPWVKGSTMYAGHLVAEHPVKAAVLGQIGKTGHEQTQAALGPVPSYLEGVFPVGDRLVNPMSAAILQTPAQVGYALSGLATGDASKIASLSNFATPAANLAAAEIFRRDPSTGAGYKGGVNALQIGRHVLGDRLPQVTLARRIQEALAGEGQNRLYPPNVGDAIRQFFVGGIAPRKYNPTELRRLYEREQTQIRTGR